ncbi:hypothetical protein YPPY03_3597, partial [Yersinia pestis PY-03]
MGYGWQSLLYHHQPQDGRWKNISPQYLTNQYLIH